MRVSATCAAVAAAAFLSATSASAAVVTFFGDAAGFDAAAATVGASLLDIDFDDVAAGTDLTGGSLGPITFTSLDGNTLEVVDGASTFTTPGGFSGVPDIDSNKLFPTSGANVLSPGGLELVPGPGLGQQDSMELIFADPVAAIGFDILFQSYDFAPITTVRAYDAAGALLFSGSAPGSSSGGGAPAGSIFFGIVADDPLSLIARIQIIDGDGNAQFPDANLGLDSIRVEGVIDNPSPVSAPATIALMGVGLLGLAGFRRRRAF